MTEPKTQRTYLVLFRSKLIVERLVNHQQPSVLCTNEEPIWKMLLIKSHSNINFTSDVEQLPHFEANDSNKRSKKKVSVEKKMWKGFMKLPASNFHCIVMQMSLVSTVLFFFREVFALNEGKSDERRSKNQRLSCLESENQQFRPPTRKHDIWNIKKQFNVFRKFQHYLLFISWNPKFSFQGLFHWNVVLLAWQLMTKTIKSEQGLMTGKNT